MNESKRLKILFLPAWYPSEKNQVSGIFIREHAKAVSLYDDVIVLYNEGCDKRLKNFWQIISDEKEEEIRTIRIKHKKSPIPKTSYLIYFFSLYASLRKLIKERWKPDIIHAHVFSAGVPAVILGKIYKIPVVITEHYTGFPRHNLGTVNVLKARFAMKRAKIVLPVSNNLKESIKAYGINSKFEVVPNATDTNIFYPSVKIKSNIKKRILLVALLSPAKGIPYLINALAEVKQQREDFVLDIVGDGPNRFDYENMCKEFDLTKFVTFHGLKSKKEVAEYMRNADFFVLPSLWENLPCVLIESMASGLPIIVTRVGGIPEIINDRIGILVPPKDTQTLTEVIDYMLDHYKDYVVEDIVQYTNDHFSYEAVGNHLEAIYNRLIYNEKERFK